MASSAVGTPTREDLGMTTLRLRARAAIAGLMSLIVTAAMVASGPTAAASTSARAADVTMPEAATQEPPFDWAALVPTAASLLEVQVGLPADPVAATERLVDIAWGDDSLAAVSAVGEILRRAGLPLVSAYGPVVALPDGGVIVNAPIIVEFLPTLTDAARNGTMHTPDQVADLLSAVGFTHDAAAPHQVIGLLAAWGKGHQDIPEVRAAGIAARAVARARGQLLIPSTIPLPDTAARMVEDPASIPSGAMAWFTQPGAVMGVDPITTVLLLAHIVGEMANGVEVIRAGSGLRNSATHAFATRGDSSICDTFGPEPGSTADQQRESGAKEYLKNQAQQAVADAAGRFAGEAVKDFVNAAGGAYDKAADLVSAFLLMLGATLDLQTDMPTTHFRHKKGEGADTDVRITATAQFKSALAKERLRCWSLIGISVPPNGPLTGYTVKWSMEKAQHALAPFSESAEKFRKGGVTDNNGVSKVSLYTRTELEPPRDEETLPEMTINATITAGLDKDEFPWKIGDLIAAATAGGLGAAAASVLYNMLVTLIKSSVLPTRTIQIQVKYHGKMPVVMVGEMKAVSTFVKVEIDVRADLYSCTGPLGPWEGTVGAGGDVAITHTGDAPEVIGGGQSDFPMRFELAKTGQPQRFHVAEQIGIQVELDVDEVERLLKPTVVRDTYDVLAGKRIVVGSGTWTVEGQEIARKFAAARYMTWAPGTERFDAVTSPNDPRCKGSSYWDNSFDRTERGG